MSGTDPSSNRPGHPDGAHPLAVLAYLGALFVLGATGWALVAAAAWAVWAVCVYTLVVLSWIAAAAVAVGAVYLIARGNRRAQVIGGGLFGVAICFVYWVVTR